MTNTVSSAGAGWNQSERRPAEEDVDAVDRTTHAGGRLVEPPDQHARRLTLLRHLEVAILILLLAGLAALLVDPSSGTRRGAYTGLIIGMAVPVIVALAFGRAGRYLVSAWLTVAMVVAAPWLSLILDPAVSQGDLMPLSFVGLSVMLSAMLLDIWATVLLAAVQWLALLLLALATPRTAFNWASLLTLVFFVSVLAGLYSYLTRRDLAQINSQAEALLASRRQLHEQMIRDPLTSLFNWRYLEETLDFEIEHAAKSRQPLGMIILDVDHFKQLNDTLGHSGGDVVLQRIGAVLADNVRDSDVACRYGGDEFILFMPDADRDMTMEMAELLLSRVHEMWLPSPNSHQPTVTASAGVAMFPEHGDTGAQLFESADAALYSAKARGRDQVAVADQSNS